VRAARLVSARVEGERRLAAHVPECTEVGGVAAVRDALDNMDVSASIGFVTMCLLRFE
jgi:hypothetical protein